MTLPIRPAAGGRHLAPVPDTGADMPDPFADLPDLAQMVIERIEGVQRDLITYMTLPPAPPKLARAAQLDLDQAELFLLSLDGELRAEGPRTAYLLGLAEGHLANLIEIVRAVTGPVTEA